MFECDEICAKGQLKARAVPVDMAYFAAREGKPAE